MLNSVKNTIMAWAIVTAILLVAPVSFSEQYEPKWESLMKHKVPKWMKDAKFGIYGHWGPYAVANDWDLEEGMEITRTCRFFKEMYKPESDERKMFEKKIGLISKGYGFKDLINEFKAEKFDAAEWADLIAKSGVKYAGIALIHHDGYAMWDSDINLWCAGKTGPTRDLYGELVAELRKRGLKIVGSFHNLRTHRMWNEYKEYLETAKKEGWDILVPKYSKLSWYNTDFEKDYLPFWHAQIREVIDKYQPDVIWCDGGNMRSGPVADYALDWVAHYFNKAQELGKEVSIHNKLTGLHGNTAYNFGPDFGVYTYENGRDRPDHVDRLWEDDTSVADRWPYYKGQPYKKPREIIVRLIDMVSRNGGLLMSLTPKPDGTLPEEVKELLLGVGKWLDQNGEAIFATRPWKIQTEGDDEKLKMYERASTGEILHIRRPDPEKLSW
ncbi:MAG: alpha-L-fucosidase, partial [Planctomycetota bacterium]